jgi:hypothetical protein
MSEFDKLKDEAEKEAKEHPQQVKEGEQAAEKKLGLGGQDDQGNASKDENAGQSQGQGDGQPQGS